MLRGGLSGQIGLDDITAVQARDFFQRGWLHDEPQSWSLSLHPQPAVDLELPDLRPHLLLGRGQLRPWMLLQIAVSTGGGRGKGRPLRAVIVNYADDFVLSRSCAAEALQFTARTMERIGLT